MYCPQCLTEYREGFQKCSDCDVSLRPGPPPQPAEPEFQAMDPKTLVTVLETNDSLAVTLAKAALEDAGIGCRVMGGDPLVLGSPPCSAGQAPLCNGWWRIQVAPEDEMQAHALLEPLENPTPFLTQDSDPERK